MKIDKVKIRYNKIEGSMPYVQVEDIVDFETALGLMDETLKEEVCLEFSPCGIQQFMNEYCKAHFKEFGKEFKVN